MSIDGPIHGKTNGKTKSAPPRRPKGARSPPARGPRLRRYTTLGVDPLDTRSSTTAATASSATPTAPWCSPRAAPRSPKSWSQLATDIVVSKYFRRAGLHGRADLGETSVRQVVYRIAHTIREAGEARGYFVDADEATPSRPSSRGW